MSLNDARLQRRFDAIVASMTKTPDESFPKVFSDDSELEATYRFLNNERVSADALLAPHISDTIARAAREPLILVAHDTTAFTFGGEHERGDVGSLDGKRAGFLGHFALAATTGEARRVLGVVGFEPTFRIAGRKKEHWRSRRSNPDRESLRWLRMADVVGERLAGRAESIHLMDSEGDDYALLAHLIGGKHRFVIRSAQKRKLDGGDDLMGTIARCEAVACRQVSLGERTRMASRGKSRHEPRKPRTAKLQITATGVTLLRPDRRTELPEALRLNVVHVYEIDAPEGGEPVDWKLYTTEAIDTPEQMLAVVDHYRNRWIIEEFFKALKSGCAYEKRQLENRGSLLNALGILVPIAWQLLVLRDESRSDAPSCSVLTARQIEVLRATSKRPLPANPTARETMLAVAKLGGHITNNGEPGWMVLGRGLFDLIAYEVGWVAARAARSDQS